jgi:hypothetical protein
MSKNLCGKYRDKENPYEIWRSFDGTWEWRVLKKYQSPEREEENPFARWMCAVRSPHTYGSFDIGDVYVKDIKQYAVKITTR